MFHIKRSADRYYLSIITIIILHCFFSVPLFADTQELYLLITSEDLRESFQPLVDHRCSQGMDGILITVEAIDANNLFTGNDIQEKLRSCIQSYYDPNQTVFLVLGGDENTVPVRYCTADDGWSYPTDLYYADMDGTQWDRDEDGIYGELDDVGQTELTPEVCFGRIPVSKPEDAESYVTKAIRYDSIDANEFIDSILLWGGSGFDGFNSGPSRPQGYKDHDPVSDHEIGMTDVFLNTIQPFWQPGRLVKYFDTNTDWDMNRFGDYHLTFDNVVETLSNDYHYIFYNNHSCISTWFFPDETGYGSGFNKFSASRLTNTLPSIIFARGCSTGHYDGNDGKESLCEALIRNPNGGPVILFAHSRTSGGSPHWDQIYQNVFQESHYRIGEAYRACLTALASLERGSLGHQYVFVLLGDPALACHRQTKKTLQLFSPKGMEVIESGTDLYVRWNAAGSFSPKNTVYLEYSDNDGANWYPIPDANELCYNEGVFVWSQCPLSNGSQYRVRVSSNQDPNLFSESAKPFTITEMGKLTVKSTPCIKVPINGTHTNQTEYICSAIRGRDYQVIAPEITKEGLEFVGWFDVNGLLLSDNPDYEFYFDQDTTVSVCYAPSDTRMFYVNDELGESGISAGNNDFDGLSPETPKASIQQLLDQYPDIGYGDIIYISDGRYNESITIDSTHSGVKLLGTGQYGSIIDGEQKKRCLTLSSDVVCFLEQLGFEDGYSDGHGGAIQMDSDTQCIIWNCRFENNNADGKGGAIHMSNSSAITGLKVYDSIFYRNHGNKAGVLFTAKQAHAEFYNCTFQENTGSHSGAFRIAVEGSVYFDSCTFQDNNAEDKDGGGAIHIFSTEPSHATNCQFINNKSNSEGAAINLIASAELTLDQCMFRDNALQNDNSTIFVTDTANLSITDCLFENNSKPIVAMQEAKVDILNSTFEKNLGGVIIYADTTIFIDGSHFISNTNNYGGSIECHNRGNNNHAQIHIIQSIFENNYATSLGGALWCSSGWDYTNITVENCTFFGNNAWESGGAIYVNSGINVIIRNSIFWQNGSLPLDLPSNAIVSYSNTEHLYPGTQNIAVTPLFINPGYLDDNNTSDDESDDFWVSGDYHLQSQTGRWDPVLIQWVNDDLHSPCIDAGDPNAPIGDEIYPNGNRINMGAYGGTDQASMSNNLNP